MSQPLDRSHQHDQLGTVDTEAGEFWVASPFQMPQLGHNLSAFERNRLFLNVDGARFIDASFASPASIDSDSRSVIAADFDTDGDVDLIVGSVGGGPLRQFENQIDVKHHRVRIELEGTSSNRLAVGTRVTVECGTTKIVRDVFPVNGFMGQSPVELVVGVGEANRIDKITLRWPNGDEQAFEDVPVDRILTFVEGLDDYGTLSF